MLLLELILRLNKASADLERLDIVLELLDSLILVKFNIWDQIFH